MRIKISYNNGLPSTEIESQNLRQEGGLSTPIQLKVLNGSAGSKARTLTNYMAQLEYCFRCIHNPIDTGIKGVEIDDIYFLPRIIKDENIMYFGEGGAEDAKMYDLVIYDISAGKVVEKKYLTKTEEVHEAKGENVSEVQTVINKLYRGIEDKTEVDVLAMILTLNKYLKKFGYTVQWGGDAKGIGKIRIQREGVVITMDGVEDEDVYTVLKIFMLSVAKKRHIGVYFINTMNYKPQVLECLLKIIELVYQGESVVFIYNAEYIKGVEMETVILPNYLATKSK